MLRNTVGRAPLGAAGNLASGSMEGRWVGSLQGVVPSELKYAMVRYAGFDLANLELFHAEVEISDCTITDSSDNGVFAEDAQLHLERSHVNHNATRGLYYNGQSIPIEPILVDNEFSRNGIYAVYLIFGGGCGSNTEMHGNTGSGNGGVNGIFVEGYVLPSEDCQWAPNPGFPYVVWSLPISAGGRLQLDPGVVVKFVAAKSYFNPPQWKRGTGTLPVNGRLDAQGTPDQPIAFTSFWDDTIGGDTNGDGNSTQPASGDWIGLWLQAGSHTILDHTSVHYGGSTGVSVWVEDATLQLTHSDVAFSADRGLSLRLSGPDVRPSIQNTTFSGNQGYAATVWASSRSPIGFEFLGNQSDPNQSNGANGIQLDVTLDTQTLQANPTLPYVVQNVNVPAGKTVAVAPGTVFKAGKQEAGGGSQILVNGVLQAQGQQGSPVTFTSLHDDSVGGNTLPGDEGILPQPGDWRGINTGSGGQATLAYSSLLYAGSDGAGFLCAGGGHATLQDSTVAYNANGGMSNQAGATLTVSHSVIHDNAGDGLANGGTATVGQTDIYGNQNYGINSWAAGLLSAENNYWGAADGPSWDGYPYCNPPPSGHGDKVTCWSVDYKPFASAPFH